MPWFGGKRRAAAVVWERLGNVPNYIEPFCGSAAVLLARSDAHQWWNRTETINDADGMISNLWRAIRDDPDAVARWADWPVNENDLHARHAWLTDRTGEIVSRLEGDPAWYDVQIAGWWLWGICAWIGHGWCFGAGPWQVVEGRLVRIGNAGHGINRKLPHLGDAGRGINRNLPHLGDAGRGHADAWSDHLRQMMARLADRLRRVQVACGDWSRICGPAITTHRYRLTGVFLDPPYDHRVNRNGNLYRVEMSVTSDVRRWAIEHGDDPRMRIALCGYDDEHTMPDNWTVYRWSAVGGYGSRGTDRINRHRETIWFSPHCVSPGSHQQSELRMEKTS